MAIGDIKTFTITYSGLELQVDAIDNGDGTTQIVIKCITGYADINAFYWHDGDTIAGEGTFDGLAAKKDSSLNMNGTGEAWDGGLKLSSAGLGTAGTDKPTYLTAGETLNAFSIDVPFDSLDTIGVRATSTSNPEGSIKGVGDDPVETPAPVITVDDAACIEEGGESVFTISLNEAYAYDIKVYYETQGGTATQGDDYTGADSYVIIPAGETSVEVKIQTIDDEVVEGDVNEHYTLVLTKAEVNLDDDADIELTFTAADAITDAEGEGCIIDNDETPDPNPGPEDPSFPAWPQDISHIVLYFDASSAPESTGDDKPAGGDGYYLVKIDEVDGANPDLDEWLDDVLAYLETNDPNIDAESDLLGVAIKGGNDDGSTQFYAYGSHNLNGDAADAIPAGAPTITTPPDQGDVNGNLIDETYQYDTIFP
jgi:hypothetical protein